MLVCFGDSFTYGFNFNEEERVDSVYPSILGRKMGQDVSNLALPGAGNWRTARRLLSTPLSKDDTVVISWTTPDRFELGVSESHYSPPIADGRVGDLVEVSGKLITKRFFEQLTDRTSDPAARLVNETIYKEFNNRQWFEEIFKVMYASCVYNLEQSGCKWCMFNAWSVQADGEYHKNYLHSGKTMSEVIGAKGGGYWSKPQHEQVAEVLMQELNKLYG